MKDIIGIIVAPWDLNSYFFSLISHNLHIFTLKGVFNEDPGHYGIKESCCPFWHQIGVHGWDSHHPLTKKFWMNIYLMFSW